MSAMPEVIATAIQKVMGGIGNVPKSGRNKDQDYAFAKVEDLLGKLQPLLAEQGLIITPNELDSLIIGGDQPVLVNIQTGHPVTTPPLVLKVQFEFILSHVSGVEWDARPKFSGMCALRHKSGGYDDKAQNKCLTSARKYFLMALFNIPVGLPDTDAGGGDDQQQDQRQDQRQQQGRQDQRQQQSDKPPGEVVKRLQVPDEKATEVEWGKWRTHLLGKIEASGDPDKWTAANINGIMAANKVVDGTMSVIADAVTKRKQALGAQQAGEQ